MLRSLLTWTLVNSKPVLELDTEFAVCEVGSEPTFLGLLVLEDENRRGKPPKGLVTEADQIAFWGGRANR